MLVDEFKEMIDQLNKVLCVYEIYDEEDLNIVKERLSQAKQIYSTCCDLMEEVA